MKLRRSMPRVPPVVHGKVQRITAPAPVVVHETPAPLVGRKVLSYSVFSVRPNDARALGLYHRSLPANLRAAMVLAPDWTVIVHCDSSMMEHPYGKVLVAADRVGLLELQPMPDTTELCKAMLWRMRPLWFDDVALVACRDVDALFMARDRIVLETFADSDAWVHSVTDNVAHSPDLMGGMSAYKREPFRAVMPDNWDRFIGLAPAQQWRSHGADQDFLNHRVWPKLGQRALVHRLQGRSTASLDPERVGILREVAVGADELAPYIGVSGFDVERAVAFFDALPETEPLRRIEYDAGWAERPTNYPADPPHVREAVEVIEARYTAACAEPSDINEHLSMLRSYASRCRHITEMGVRKVVSSWAFLAGRPKRMVSYDISKSEQVSELESLASVACAGGFEFRQQSTLEADIEETDLLFIDTLHTYAQLSAELARHAPRARRWIIMHDTSSFADAGEDGTTPGLRQAIEEFLARGGWRVCKHRPNNNGLTVLVRK